MRKMVLGASMAASAFLMSGENAGGQEADICDAVYDETTTGDSSVQLRRLIGEYAANGVEVHVQIVEEGETLGFDSVSEVESASERLIKECDWQEPDIVNVIISLDPRAYDIYRTPGQARQDISQAESDRAAEGLVDDLRDSSTSFQSDVANALERMNPYESNEEPTNTPGDSEAGSEDTEPLSIPVKKIGFGLAGSLAALGIGSRTVQGVRISRVNRRAQKEISVAQVDLLDTITPAEAQLSILPLDDATALRQLVKDANQHRVDLSNSAESMNSVYHRERVRLWPAKRRLDELAEQIDGATSKAGDTSNKTALELKDVEDNIVCIDEMMGDLSSTIAATSELFTRLRGEGWDLSSLETEKAEFVSILAEVQQLKDKHYIDKPVDLMKSVMPKLDNFYKLVEKLPERRTNADALPTKQVEEIKKRKKTVQAAQQTLADLKEGYSKSCYEDLADHDDNFDEQIGSLTELNQKVSELVGVQSSEAVTNAEAAEQHFAETCAKIDAMVAEIKTRADNLAQIKSGLPARLSDIEEQIETALEFSSENVDDVEEETRDKLKELQTTFRGFRQKDVGADKPNYLAIDEETTQFNGKVASLFDQARQEKTEMDDLRRDSARLEADAENALSDLRSYISRHSSDVDSSTETKARQIELIAADCSLTRSGLRAQVKDLEELVETIGQVKGDAKSDVRREEEEEEHRRRQRMAASTSSHSSGGFDFGGGGGSKGGGHSSGSW